MPGVGGKRKGAGRKKGVPNKVTKALREHVAKTGETPLEYFVNIYRNPKMPPERRDYAAAQALPYQHSKMPVAITASMTHQGTVQHQHEHRMIHEVKDITPKEAAELYAETLHARTEFKPKLIASK
jgi:hypothetical protein